MAEDSSVALTPERPGTLAGTECPYGQVPGKRSRVIPYSWLIHSLRQAPATHDWHLAFRGEDSGARLRVFMAGDIRIQPPQPP